MTNKLNQFTTHYSLLTKSAFTLAETLIVMGIIGVVAALTLPNLNSSTGDKEKIVKVKKIYQNLSDAIGRAEAVYGPINEWTITKNEGSIVNVLNPSSVERITEFLKISKNCAIASNQGCFNQSGVNYANGTIWKKIDELACYYKFILADGSSVAVGPDDVIGGLGETLDRGILNFYVDIDGPNKGASTLGKDIFYFKVANNTNYLAPNSYTNFASYLTELKKQGATASGWIINCDNMDYLKFDSNGKCPNNVTVNETNPSCK